MDERRRCSPTLDCQDLPDEEGVVTGSVLFGSPALEPPQGVVDEGGPGGSLASGDSVPVRERRDATGEVLRDRVLIAGEKAHREAARLAQELVHCRLAVDRDADQRRRQRDECADGQSEALAVRVDRQNRDPGGKTAQECPELLVLGRQRRRSTSSASTRDSSTLGLAGSAIASCS
jgi:hypothetical protein